MWRSIGRHLGWVILLASVLPPVSFAEQLSNGFQILYHEPVTGLRFDEWAAGDFLSAKPSERRTVTRASFDAFGRRFDLELELNTRLLKRMAPGARDQLLSRTSLFRGVLEGSVDSWARLAVADNRITGVIWDGHELYSIEPASDVAPYAVQPLNTSLGDTVIYRWSDVAMPAAAFCGVEHAAAPASGLQQYKNLVNELERAFLASSVPTLEITLGGVGDDAYRALRGINAESGIASRLNVVDGIFSDQVGVNINLTEIIVHDAASDPFSATILPIELLNEFSDYKFATPELRSAGLAHLFTGRDLDGTTVGTAFVGAICRQQFGAGLTESRNSGATFDGLIAAHEIGHNFGAPHDGDPNEACAGTPDGMFLMATMFNGSSTFSQCSIDEMTAVMNVASCLTPFVSIDISVALPVNPINQNLNDTFDYQIRVTNLGSEMASSNSVNVTLDGSLTFIGATGQQGVCTTSAGGVDCPIIDLAGGAQQNLMLTLRATQAGSFPSNVSVTTMSSDTNLTNNTVTAIITITDPQAGGGGGGGGATNLPFTLLLMLLVLVSLRRIKCVMAVNSEK